MTAEPEIALVLSPEPWVEALHRYVTDHGGARVRQMVVDPAVLLDEAYDVLVVSHRWPALTRPLVEALHARGRRILGVVDPGEPGGRGFLAGLGVDATVDADATTGELVEALVGLGPARSAGADPRGATGRTDRSEPDHPRPCVVGGPAGAGSTEVAVQIAACLTARGERVVLVDADDVAPSVAPRLGLPVEPSLRTAVDAVEHGLGDLDASLLPGPDGCFAVVAGLPSVTAWSQVRPGEVLDVLRTLARRFRVVADTGSRLEDVGAGGRARYGITRAVLAGAGSLVGVGAAGPVGVVRLLDWVAEVRLLAPEVPLHLVLNRAPREPFKRAELEHEVVLAARPLTLDLLPHDRRVEAASWSGGLAAPGPFTRAVDRLAAAAVPALHDRARRPAFRHAARPRPARSAAS